MTAAASLHEAKNAAGRQAEACARRGYHHTARQWVALAVDIDALLRRAIALAAGMVEAAP